MRAPVCRRWLSLAQGHSWSIANNRWSDLQGSMLLGCLQLELASALVT